MRCRRLLNAPGSVDARNRWPRQPLRQRTRVGKVQTRDTAHHFRFSATLTQACHLPHLLRYCLQNHTAVMRHNEMLNAYSTRPRESIAKNETDASLADFSPLSERLLSLARTSLRMTS